MIPLVNHWSPLTHTSHCMTTSRPAADTQMRARVSPAMYHKVFFTLDALPATTLTISKVSETGLQYSGLHILKLGPEKQHQMKIYIYHILINLDQTFTLF